MYGKHFESMYTGSMLGQGALTFAVWGYVISHFHDDVVELNAELLATLIGESQADIQVIIEKLCQPDPNSRSKEQEGCRLVKIGQFAYRVVNGQKYRAMRDENARREYQRNWDREHRPSGHKRTQSDTVRQPDIVRHSPTQAEAEAEAKNKRVFFSSSKTIKAQLFPIAGKICSKNGCRMPAVYKDASGAYDSYRCLEHLPPKVKEVYG